MAVMPHRTLDCIGLFCPVPILRTQGAMGSLRVGEVVELLADDPAAEGDLRSWLGRTGHELISVDRHGAVFRFLVRKTR
jgi:tRNA 2-thiouridine synthesizing protein A